jgi:hypothetical protein
MGAIGAVLGMIVGASMGFQSFGLLGLVAGGAIGFGYGRQSGINFGARIGANVDAAAAYRAGVAWQAIEVISQINYSSSGSSRVKVTKAIAGRLEASRIANWTPS